MKRIGSFIFIMTIFINCAYNKNTSGIIETVHGYEPHSLVSNDGDYVLQTEKIEDDTGVYVSFFIALKDGPVVFRCPEKYRAMDVKTITWAEGSNDVVVTSFDERTYRYIYKYVDWIREFNNTNKSKDSELDMSDFLPIPRQHIYEICTCLHENMPEYRFVATGENFYVTSLYIYNKNNLPILSKDFEPKNHPVYSEMMDTMGLHVTDVNFDGYKDVIILSSFHGAHGNTWYDCWLWDIESLAFVYSESFAGICNPAINWDKQCIYSSGGSGASILSSEIYKFIDGKFVISNSLLFEWDYKERLESSSSGFRVLEEQLKNDELEIVKDIIVPSEQADAEIEYYKNDEIWQLNHPRWYMIGGHHADQWLEE